MTFIEQIQTELPYRRELRRLAFNVLKSESDVEDVLQMVHLRAWTAAASGEVVEDAKAFLRKITRNEALNHLRKQRREESVKKRYSRGEGGAVALRRDLVDVVRPALTDRQQELVDALVDTGSYAQAALHMGISLDAARELGERAIEQLRGEA